MSESSNLPTAAFDILLPKLIAILELTQPSQQELSSQARQALLVATNEFKDALNNAKSLVNALPGAELQLQDQDEVIEMLERLRDKKKKQLEQFSQYTAPASSTYPMEDQAFDLRMEVDSTASTPGQ